MKFQAFFASLALNIFLFAGTAQAAPQFLALGLVAPVKIVNTPLPVTGTVNLNSTATVPLVEMIGIPMNYQSPQPLDTSNCGALRVVLKSVAAGPSLLFTLRTPVAGEPTANTTYFSTLVSAGDEFSEVVDLPPPSTNIAMGVSGDCNTCVLAIYCR